MVEPASKAAAIVDSKTSDENAKFWNEPCGTHAAQTLGVTDASVESLERFDRWYFEHYPYLNMHIPFSAVAGKKVLEIGLGYGSVSQRLAESGCDYVGLDIARGPVDLVNHRLAQNNLRGHAEVGSILAPPFQPASFDFVIAIGCLHHTGNLALAIEQCRTLLKPGGQLVFMVYSALSYRRWWTHFGPTARYFLRELTGYRGVVGSASENERAAYDTSLQGQAAPHTDFISARSLRKLCSGFSSFTCHSENIDSGVPFIFWERRRLLDTPFPSLCGLDLYARATR